MARDVYLNMAARWALPPFANIAKSEQQHMDALKAKLDKYSLPDPAQPEIGAFKNAELQTLYDELMDRGETSYLEALRVGGLIEEVDIEDIENAIAAASHADLAQVYGNLLRGSRNHLRAFAREIERQGGYTRPNTSTRKLWTPSSTAPWNEASNRLGRMRGAFPPKWRPLRLFTPLDFNNNATSLDPVLPPLIRNPVTANPPRNGYQEIHRFSILTAQMILGHGASLLLTARHEVPLTWVRDTQPNPDPPARSNEAFDLTNGERS